MKKHENMDYNPFSINAEIDGNLPKFDLPTEFIVGDFVTKEILDFYKWFPCKIKAGIFVLVTGGHLHATVNLDEHHIKPNDFVTLTPGSFIQIHDIQGDIRLHFVGFSSKFIEGSNYLKSSLDFLPFIIENPILGLSDEMALLCRDFIHLLIRATYANQPVITRDTYRSVLSFFLHEIGQLYKSRQDRPELATTREQMILKEFMQILLQKYTQEHSVSYYAKALGITLQHFCNTIKKATGKTALDIIANIIIMDAKAQLKATDLAIKEIAISLGFTNQAFFNKYFKHHVGMTPQEYRKS